MSKILTEEQRLKRNKYASDWQKRNKEKVYANVRRWSKANPEKRKEIRDSWKQRNPAKVSAMRARKRGHSWGISEELYRELRSKPCHYCNSKITSLEGGLDRINTGKGYEPDNVLPCCYSCNVTRNEFYTVPEMEVMIKALLDYRGKK